MNPKSLKRGLLALLVTSLLGGLVYGWFAFVPSGFEFTGTVRDFQNKQPIEGAYVVAIYYKVFTGSFWGFDRVRGYCVLTRGQYTGKDGTFHFPVGRMDGTIPTMATAIKPGYFLRDIAIPGDSRHFLRDREDFADRDVLLQIQDPKKLSMALGESEADCQRPQSPGANEAAVTYALIAEAEKRRLESGPEIPQYGTPEWDRAVEEWRKRKAEAGRQ